MADLSLLFGGDLNVGPTGDLALSDGSALTEQRVLRRLLTNVGDYLWQLNYGAGLGQFVGQPAAATVISGIVRTQMLLEAAVSRSPAPTVGVTSTVDGTVNLTIQYVDALVGQTNLLSFSL